MRDTSPVIRGRSIIRNTVLNYSGQAYVMLVGILIMPFYLGHLGAEAYGLIGFFTLLQAWLQLLDAGLSPSLVRAVAHQQGTPVSEKSLGRLLRSFELIFLPITMLCGLLVHVASPWIAAQWLNANTLQPDTLAHCITLMGIVIALRLYSTLYKSAIQGLEQHAWLNAANVSIATLRYFGGLLLVSQFSRDPQDFFVFQLVVGLLEALLFASKARRQMPAPPTWQPQTRPSANTTPTPITAAPSPACRLNCNCKKTCFPMPRCPLPSKYSTTSLMKCKRRLPIPTFATSARGAL